MFNFKTYKQILLIAFPIMIGMVSQNIIQITNTAFLGRLGEESLGVSAMGGLFYMLLSVLSWGFSNGTQILVARRLGEKRFSEIGSLTMHNIVIMCVYAVVAFLVLQFGAEIILAKVIHSKSVFDKSISFLKYRSWGILFTVFISTLNAFYIGLGRTKVITYSTLVTAAINIFLDYSLIFGHFHFPALQTDGAAIASIIAELGGLAVLLYNLFLHNYFRQYNFSFQTKFEKEKFKQLLKLSSPLVLQYSFSFGAWYLFFIVLENMGEQTVAIANIMRSILFLFTISCWAIASSCNSLVSNKIGEGKKYEVIETIKSAGMLSFLISLFFVILLWLFAKPIMHIYTNKIVLINGAIEPLYMLGVAILFLSFSTVVFQGVQGTGNTMFNLLAEFISVLVYCAYVFGFVNRLQLSLTWAWASELFYWTSLVLLSIFYLKSGRWKLKKI